MIDYAVTVIPPEKIQLGIPNYGYDWALPYIRGESRATTVSNTEAVDLARKRGVTIEYDETSAAPTFNYFDRPSTYSDAIEHEVWFENGISIDSKLRLISEYGLNGASVWNIMKYFPQLWLTLNQLFTIRRE